MIWRIALSLQSNLQTMLVSFLNAVLLFSMPGGSEWILILLAILLFFGGRKIPELMRGIGRGVREFNDAKTNVKSEIEEGIKEKDLKKDSLSKETHQAQA